jgi:hypothetical protein
VTITDGMIAPGEVLRICSEMNEGGIVFGDGIEDDHIDFHFGQDIEIGAASDKLRLLAA